ncbi:MAG: zf-HC2 domain-containing protein [Planctomycetota bacterium]
MKCKKINCRLSDYIDRQLPEKQIDLIENHLSSCEECARECTYLKNLEGLLKEQPVFEPSEEYWDNYVENLRKKQSRYLDIPFKESSSRWSIQRIKESFLFRSRVSLIPAFGLMVLLALGLTYFIQKIQESDPKSLIAPIPDSVSVQPTKATDFAALQKLIRQSGVIKDGEEIINVVFESNEKEEVLLIERTIWMIEKVINMQKPDEMDLNFIRFTVANNKMLAQFGQLKEKYADQDIAEKIKNMKELLSMISEKRNDETPIPQDNF